MAWIKLNTLVITPYKKLHFILRSSLIVSSLIVRSCKFSFDFLKCEYCIKRQSLKMTQNNAILKNLSGRC